MLDVRREDMRRRILRESLDLFAHFGFENTTVRMIARRCGVTDAALYYYFESKREILAALWDTPQVRVLAKVDPSHPLTVARLLELVDEMLTASAETDALIRVMIRQALSNDPAAVAFRQRTMNAWRRDVRAHFETTLPPAAAELNADLLTAFVFGATFQAQAAMGAGYPDIARSEAFRDAVKWGLLCTLPFCRASTTM
jgi:AcrR family transcriptional regulator